MSNAPAGQALFRNRQEERNSSPWLFLAYCWRNSRRPRGPLAG